MREQLSSSRRIPAAKVPHLLDQAGVALVEFAIIAPFLIVFMFGALELARAINLSKTVTTLSREGAITAMRECSPAWSDDVSPCLARIQAELQSAAVLTNRLSNPRVVVSLYRWDSGIVSLGVVPNDGSTRVCIGSAPGCTHPLDISMVQDAGMVAVAEVHADYNPIIPNSNALFFFNPTHLYDVTYF